MKQLRRFLPVLLVLALVLSELAVLVSSAGATVPIDPRPKPTFQAGNNLVLNGQIIGCSCPVVTGNCVCKLDN